MVKKQTFCVHGREISFGPDLPELSPFTRTLYEIIIEIAVESNTPDKVTVTSNQLYERFIAKGYDPETGQKMN